MNMSVLVAEDDLTSRILLETLFKNWGYNVTVVPDGDTAWELLQQENAPRLVVLDWMMPGKDGISICADIRKRIEDNPPYIILLTALGHKEDIITGLEAGADDYVTKPFDRGELRARVKTGERILQLQASLAQRLVELQDALDHVKTLQGIIPICMYCHKIQNDEHAWQRVEVYLQQHSDAKFTHGLCPECFEKRYSEYSDTGQDDE